MSWLLREKSIYIHHTQASFYPFYFCTNKVCAVIFIFHKRKLRHKMPPSCDCQQTWMVVELGWDLSGMGSHQGTLFRVQGGQRQGVVLLLWLQRLLVGRKVQVRVPSVKFRLSEMDVRGRTHKSGRMGSRNINLHPDTIRVE